MLEEHNSRCSVSLLLTQWKKNFSNESDKAPWDFVSTQNNISSERRTELAIALITEDFRQKRARDEMIWIEKEMTLLLPGFLENGIDLDENRVLESLIQADIQTTRHRLTPESMIERFPHMEEYIRRCFKISEKFLESVTRRLNEEELNDFGNPIRPINDVISLTEEYSITKFLNFGGQKNVYEVEQQSTEQHLAFKELKKRHHSNSLQRSAMLSEATIQAQLSHPNIPIILSLSDNKRELPVFVERLISGVDWRSVMDGFSLERNISLLLNVSRVVAYVHQRRIIHGDLKPENVMIGESGDRYNNVYLVDWGYALSLDDPNIDDKPLGGTISYMPPEALSFMPSRMSPASDVFMLGGILYLILSGKAPYEDPYYLGPINALKYVEQVLIDPIPTSHPVSGCRNPNELIEIVNKALQRNPKDRYANADQFADALERYQTRISLVDRLEKAKSVFTALQQRIQTEKNIAAEPRMLELIENVNEFRLIRESSAKSEHLIPGELKAELFSPSGLYLQAAQSERLARSFLIDTALETKDFGIAAAQIKTAENFLQQEIILENNRSDANTFENDSKLASGLESETAVNSSTGCTLVSSVDIADETSRLQTFRVRFQQGLAARRRERFIKWSLVGVSCLAMVTLLAFFRLMAVNADQEKLNIKQKLQIEQEQNARISADTEHKNQLLAEEKKRSQLIQTNLYKQIQLLSETAEREKFGQGKLAFLSKLPENSGEIPSAWQAETTVRTALLPEEVSPGKEIIDTVSFSDDESFFATLSAEHWITFYPTYTNQTDKNDSVDKEKTLKNVVYTSCTRYNVAFGDNVGECYLLANPLFQNNDLADPVLSCRFLLCTQKGQIAFLSERQNSPSQIININDINDFSEKEEVDLGKPVFVLQKNVTTQMIVNDDEGKILFFSFPEGELLQTVQAHKNGISSLTISNDGQTLATAGKDGLFKLWKSDGTPLKTLDLPLPKTPHDYWGYMRRIAFSPNAKFLLIGCETGKILVWDITKNALVTEITEPEISGTHGNIIQRVFWLDEKRFLTFCLNNHYRIWDISKRSVDGLPEYSEIQVPESRPYFGLRTGTLSPSKKRLLISENNHLLSIFDTETGKKTAVSAGLTKSRNPNLTISDAVYHPGADRIIAGTNSYNSLVSFVPEDLNNPTEYIPYNVRDSKSVQQNDSLVSSIAVPDIGDEFAVALGSGCIQFFKTDQPLPIRTLTGLFSPFISLNEKSIINLNENNMTPFIAASPNGKTFVHTNFSPQGKITLCQWEDGKIIRSWDRLSNSLDLKNTTVDFSKMFNLSNPIYLPNINSITWQLHKLHFVSENILLELTVGGKLIKWDVQTGKQIAQIDLIDPSKNIIDILKVSASSVSPDKKQIAIGFSDGSIAILNTNDLSRKLSSPPHWTIPLSNYSHLNPDTQEQSDSLSNSSLIPQNAVTNVSWSSDNNLLAFSFSNGCVVITEQSNKTVLARFAIGINEMQIVLPKIYSFFTNSAKLITLSTDGLARRWNFQTSPDKFSVQKKGFTISRLTASNKNNWAGISHTNKTFIIQEGKNEIFQKKNVACFTSFIDSKLGKCFALAGINGKLLVLNARGKQVKNHPLLNAENFPSNGIWNIFCSPDNRWFTIVGKDATKMKLQTLTNKGDAVWLLDMKNISNGWKKLTLNVSIGEDDVFNPSSVTFRPDSLEMAIGSSSGEIAFWSLEKNRQLYPVNRKAIIGPIQDNKCGSITYTKSGKFLIQTGAANFAAVWDDQTRTLWQKIPLPLFDSLSKYGQTVQGLVSLDRGFGQWEEEDAFIAAGWDGILRFYQYIPEKKQFVAIYIISYRKLENLISSVNQFANSQSPEPWTGYNLFKGLLPDFSEEELETIHNDIIEQMGEMQYSFLFKMINSNPGTYTLLQSILNSIAFIISDIDVNTENETLYVGCSEVRAYDLTAIRERIDSLVSRWEKVDAESLTGLQYSDGILSPSIRKTLIVPNSPPPLSEIK